MEMNLDPGATDTVINLRGPCKLVVSRGGDTIVKVEVSSEETYRLTMRREGKKQEHLVAGITG